jgi:hypothetical protein
MALAWVDEQTPEICLEAIRMDGMALRYVEEQTPEICRIAVSKNPRATMY